MGRFVGQFKSLVHKNILTMKRNYLMTITEIFFPIILMIIGFGVRKSFSIEEHHYSEEKSIENFILDKSVMALSFTKYVEKMTKFNEALYNITYQQIISQYPQLLNNISELNRTIQAKLKNSIYLSEQEISQLNIALKNLTASEDSSMGIGHWIYVDKANGKHSANIPLYNGFSMKPLISTICYDRFIIAYIGDDLPSEYDGKKFNEICFNLTQIQSDLICQIKNSILSIDGLSSSFNQEKYSFQKFESIQELNEYILASDYGKGEKETICFGFELNKKSETNYSAKLLYFDSKL